MKKFLLFVISSISSSSMALEASFVKIYVSPLAESYGGELSLNSDQGFSIQDAAIRAGASEKYWGGFLQLSTEYIPSIGSLTFNSNKSRFFAESGSDALFRWRLGQFDSFYQLEDMDSVDRRFLKANPGIIHYANPYLGLAVGFSPTDLIDVDIAYRNSSVASESAKSPGMALKVNFKQDNYFEIHIASDLEKIADDYKFGLAFGANFILGPVNLAAKYIGKTDDEGIVEMNAGCKLSESYEILVRASYFYANQAFQASYSDIFSIGPQETKPWAFDLGLNNHINENFIWKTQASLVFHSPDGDVDSAYKISSGVSLIF